MKILIIGTAYPLKGGLASFNERLAYALQEQGHEVELYTFTLQYPGFLFPGKTQYSDEPAPEGLRITPMINSVNPLSWWKTGRKAARSKPDLILVKYWLPFMGPCFGTILRLARKNGHTRVISILDNVIPHEKRPGDVPFTRYFLKPVDAFISMSHEVLRDLRTFTKDKPALFSPHPVYDNYGDALPKAEAREFLKLNTGGRYILFFGYIRKYKGLDLLFEAMADERITRAGIRLIVAGEYYGDKEYYEQLADKLGIRDRLDLFTDFIPNSEVRYYFSAADCVVQPYRTATQSGISQIAYHFEKPMIVTNVGGLPEIVADGKVGFVVPPEVPAITGSILRFYDEEREGVFAANLAEEKKKYSWHYFTGNIMKLLEAKGTR
ncbi:glycosyltransferase [Taibaiella chishuiensis]|uniref:Glycosyltransferase involved in cell wall biosynthesis n=1 Tax=Taibaiella chishuiensis TaxID=1434707 RepID=A0A2P8CW74_9BACT|nr:glycosyltransferase [Taibaiella chishuiensis]PSK89233.1 glycosyltransferase involved in cell wall biosynthesis [Taibaiella chishuiensis]